MINKINKEEHYFLIIANLRLYQVISLIDLASFNKHYPKHINADSHSPQN